MAVAHATFSEFLRDTAMLGEFFAADSWRNWLTIAKAIYAEPLNKDELTFFKSIAGDREPPKRRPREIWRGPPWR